ncbi:hypothetical protein D3C84_1169480 [compost metagenome]
MGARIRRISRQEQLAGIAAAADLEYKIMRSRLMNFMNACADARLQLVHDGADNDAVQCHVG